MKSRGWTIGLVLGPVFAFEWLIAARRWQAYALRAGFVSLLLFALWIAWLSTVDSLRYRPANRVLAEMGQTLFYTFAGVQLAIVMVTAPGATAGAICLDRARGTLLHLLVTDLSDSEIVLGKLASRLVPMVGLVFCGLPVVALMTLLGGIDPVALTGAFLVSLGLALLGCSLALLLSNWAGKAHEVVMAVYLIWLAWLLALPIGFWVDLTLRRWFGFGLGTQRLGGLFAKANPVWIVFGPGSGAPFVEPTFIDQVGFFIVTVFLSALLVVVATKTMRPSAVRSEGRTRVRRSWIPRELFSLGRFVPAPSLDGNPVLWREWTRNRPSRWSRWIWWTYGLAACFFSGIVVFQWLFVGRRGGDMPAVVNVLQVGAGLLLLSVSASTSLVEERVRGSLDVLMTTPLSTLAIVWGKWLGAYRRAVLLAVPPGLVAAACALVSGQWYGAFLMFVSVLAQGAAVVSLGLLVATWTPRLGRAIGATVAGYILVAIGWMFVVVFLSRGAGSGPGRFLIGFSPLYNAGALTEGLTRTSIISWHFETLVIATFWALAYFGLAGGLFLITLRVFDSRLGRITGASEPRFSPGRVAKHLPESNLVEV